MTPRPPFLAGLIGAGVGPSLTPALHMQEARELGLVYVYRTIDLPTLDLRAEDVGDIVRHGRQLGFDAFNVTHPCKQLVVGHLDHVEGHAATMGVVNTVVIRDGRLIGYNTDVSGFATALSTGLPGARLDTVVLLGAGGAGTAVGDALMGLGTRRLVVVDADPARAGTLAHALSVRFPTARVDAARTDELEQLMPTADGLVHCTPTGMADHPGLPLEARLLHPQTWVADIVYRPLDTALLRAARGAGCRTLDGGHMAVHQAVDAFRLITGVEADADRMLAHFRALVTDHA